MIGKLGHHHVSQQACSRDALIDHLSRNWRLDQCFTLAAGLFTTHMLLDGEYARRVIELLADVLADTLKLAAARALSVYRFVMNHGPWKLRWQRCTFEFLARAFWSRTSIASRSILSKSSSKLPWRMPGQWNLP